MTPNPNPHGQPPAATPPPTAPPVQRPELRLVPPPTPEETTGPIQAIRDVPPGKEFVVKPQAPLDVRLLEHLADLLNARPRWSERPPSMAETWHYSTSGDWTTDEKGIKRVAHAAAVLLAFAVTYPISWAAQAAREKPIGFFLLLAVLFAFGQVL